MLVTCNAALALSSLVIANETINPLAPELNPHPPLPQPL